MANIAWVVGVGAFLAASMSAGGPGRRLFEGREAVGLRVVTTDPKAVQIELTNASSRPIDAEVLMKVSLKRLDDTKGPEHAQVIYTWVDPSTGLYKLPVPGDAPARLVLAVGETRTLKVEFSKFRWSYPAIGNRTPDELRDLAESGEFDLSTSLYGAPPAVGRFTAYGFSRWLRLFRPGASPAAASATFPSDSSQAGPVRIRLVVR